MVQSTKIFLADDHYIFRQGIRAMFDEEANIEVIGEVADGNVLIEQLHKTQVDVLVLDISMPKVSGLEIMNTLTVTFPELKVLVLSMHSNQEYARQMMQKGAKGYLLKSCSRAEIIRAIKTVSFGDTYLSQEIAKKLFTNNSNKEADIPKTPLTKREIDVLKLVTKGLTNQVIGEQLFISHRTVDTHRRNIMLKLDLHNVAALTEYAIKHFS